MNQDDAKDFFTAELIECRRKLGELLGTQPPRRQKRRGWHTGRKSDQHDVAAPANVRKSSDVLIVVHVRPPLAGGESGGLADINVVVAGDEADVLWRTKVLKPSATLPKLGGKCDVGDIASDRDVVRLLRLDVGNDRRERFRVVNEATLFLPVDVAR